MRRVRTREFAKCALLYVAAALLGLAFSASVRPYADRGINLIFQVPLVKAMIDPELYPGDYTVHTAEVYQSAFWTGLASLSRAIGFDEARRVVHVVQILLMHAAAAALLYTLGAGVVLALIGSLLMVVLPLPQVGGSFFYAAYPTHTAFVVPIIIFSLQQVLRGRIIVSSALWTAAAFIHLPNAVYFAPCLAVTAFICLRGRVARRGKSGARRRLPLWHLAAAAIIPLAVVLPFAFSLLARGQSDNPISSETFFELCVHYVMPHLSFRYNYYQSINQMVEALSNHGLLALSAAVLACAGPLRIRAAAIGWFALFIPIAIGFVASEVLESVALSRLMWMRAGDHIACFGYVYAVVLCGLWLRGRLPLAPALAPIFVYLSGQTAGQESTALPPLLFLAAALAISGPLTTWAARTRRCRRLILASPLWSVLAFFALTVTFSEMRRYTMMIHRLRHYSYQSPRIMDFYAVQRWARENTPKDALFLSPFNLMGWRTESERSTVLELRDGVTCVLSHECGQEYLRRADRLGVNLTAHTAGEPSEAEVYDAYTDADFRRITREFGVSYIVLKSDHATSLPLLMEGGTYKVVRAPAESGTEDDPA